MPCERPVPVVEDFLRDLDGRWRPSGEDRIHLRVIGSAALMLQANYERGTKDSDVLETDQLSGEARDRLLHLAGPKSVLHVRHKLYIDIVQEALPFLPQIPSWSPMTELNSSLRCFQVSVLSVVDVVVSKLKRFSANDIADIGAMVELDLVPHAELIGRFKEAVDQFSSDARADDLPTYVANLNRVERDLLVVGQTTIELPHWV